MKTTNTIKKFQFFDDVNKKDKNDVVLKVYYVLNDLTPIQMETMSGFLFISGTVRKVNHKEDNEPDSSLFKLYSNNIVDEYKLFNKLICFFKLSHHQGKYYLTALGFDIEEDEKKQKTPVLLIKIYDCSKCFNIKSPETPILLRTINITEKLGKEDAKAITCFDINEELTFAGLGLNDGRVVLITGNKMPLYDNSSSKTFTNLTGLFTKKDKNEITNLQCVKHKTDNILFVSTIEELLSYPVSLSDEKGEGKKTMYPESGILPKCFDFTQCKDRTCFSVINDSKITFYVNLDNGPSWFFEGKKKCNLWYKDYMAFVVYEEKVSIIEIFDPSNRFFAYYQNSFDKVLHLACDDEHLYILFENEMGTEKYIQILEEKQINEKFETFYKKKFFDTAYEYAKNLNYDNKILSEISRKYAMNLYEKGDYKKSIEQYILTLNYYDPSNVIQQFLDGSKLDYLIFYLEALHKDDQMKKNCPHDEMKDYTALLLNCYIKQKQLKKLQDFVDEKNINEQLIDIATAIEVCKDANHPDLALKIAEKSQFTEASIQILMEMREEYQEALQTLNKEPDLAKKFMMFQKYGEKFLAKCPELTIDYLKDLIKEIINIKQGNDNKQKETIEDIHYETIIQIFHNQEKELEQLLQYIMTNDINCPTSIIHRRIELYCEHKNKTEIIKLLRTPEYYEKLDKNYLLMLFTTHDFRNEITELSEKMGLKQELFQNYMKDYNYHKIIEFCQNNGNEDSNVWIQALTYFINLYNNNQNVNNSMVEGYIRNILNQIMKNDAISPLIILELFSKLKTCSYGLVQEIMNEHLEKWQRMSQDDKKHCDNNYNEIEKLNKEMKDLTQKYKQFNMVRCSTCTTPLTMPTTYFFCGHAYHNNCLNLELRDDLDKECPLCTKKIFPIFQRIKQSEDKKHDHNTFFTDLKERKKKNDMVAQYLGKGIFNMDDI